MFVEKYVQHARHIEIQIFGNGKGGIVALGERECSIQRRHQKIIEESPSPYVGEFLLLLCLVGKVWVHEDSRLLLLSATPFSLAILKSGLHFRRPSFPKGAGRSRPPPG